MNILSIYGSHDGSATFLDKNNQLRILELERFCDIRFAMYSSQYDHWSLGTNDEIRRNFLQHIKDEIKEPPDTIIFASLNEEDLRLLNEFFPGCKFEKFDGHHASHAYGSYFQSPFSRALIFTVDGGGSDLGMHTTTKVYKAVDKDIREIFKPTLDFGNTYSTIGIPISEVSPGKDSSDLGVFLSYAGKIMGLCAYGKVVQDWILPMENFYTHKSLDILGKAINLDLSLNSLSGENSYNLAATSQYVFENLLLDFILEFFNKDKQDIVLTGGCALNVLFNQKLREILVEQGFDLYVPPNPNDCGQSLGQYLYKTKEHIDPLVYSGFDILDKEILNDYLVRPKYKCEISTPDKIAELISDGKIGGIIQGYSEVGPRALGNRSIICDPSFKDMKDILNAKVKFREWFRPFAPVCREEDKDIYFKNAFASHYMSYAPLVKEEYKDKLPSITHNDGTSRLQTVTRKEHELFYDIIDCMSKRGKIPVILNTSFNIKGKPILTKIEDAFYVLDNTQLDFLVVDNKIVTKV